MTIYQKEILKEFIEKFLEGRKYAGGDCEVLKKELETIKTFVENNFINEGGENAQFVG